MPRAGNQTGYRVAKVSLTESAKTLYLRFERSTVLNELNPPPPSFFRSKRGVQADPQPQHLREYEHVALHADGEHAIAVQSVIEKQNYLSSFVKVPVFQFGGAPSAKLASFEDMPLAVEFSRSASKAVAMMREGSIYLFDSDSPAPLVKLELGTETTSLHSRFSANEKFLAVCVYGKSGGTLEEKEIQVFDTVNRVQVGTLPLTNSNCRSFDLSPDGKQVFFAAAANLYRWEVRTGEKTHVAKLPDSPTQLAHSPTGPFLLLGYWEERVLLANSLSGSLLAEIRVGTDWVGTRILGFGDNGADFFASTDSTDLAWGDLNRLGGPPSTVKEALRDLGSVSIRNFQATRWLSCHASELQSYLEAHANGGVLPDAFREVLREMVRDWDSEKYIVRRSASLRGVQALEKLNWGEQEAARAAVENLVAAALAQSPTPLEIQRRFEEWLQSGDLPSIQLLRESESYRRQIDAALGKPFTWGK